uniref:Uncharacterized protein n=1 Tax=Arundo donax TaxID=35708 RepID=A0A0A9CCL6_ARUDO
MQFLNLSEQISQLSIFTMKSYTKFPQFQQMNDAG